MRDKVGAELSKPEKEGIVVRSTSPWASPLGLVKKPNVEVQLCVDYRTLNSLTVKEAYYMPTLEEMLAKVGRAKCVSMLDLTKGFHQIPMSKKDRHKTAFICPLG